MASLAALRKEAKNAGISAAVIRAATSADELQSVIDDHSNGGKEAPKAPKRAVKKKSGGTRTVAKKKTAPAPAKKSVPAKSKPAAKSTQGKAKRTTTGTNGYVAKGGRNLLDSVNYSADEGWNAREGSAPSRIIKALKKARGNREKAFDALVGDVWDFVGKKMRNGDKRPLKSGPGNAHGMLRYRIARTAWDFALRTGQHEKAGNRVAYGTGGTGQGVWKPAKPVKPVKTASKPKASRKTAAAKKRK